MRRIPILSTALVAVAVAVMIGLGVWQVQRAEWKESLLADWRASQDLPTVDLDGRLRSTGRAEDDPPLDFRRVRITCEAGRDVRPEVRGGRHRTTNETGWSYFIPCFRNALSGWTGRLQVNAGWARRPDLQLERARGRLDGIVVEGVLGVVEEGRPVVLTADMALPPLAPSAAPRVEDVSNNHLFYAFQWFFFAAAAAVIYGLALRRRLSRGA